MWTEGLVAMLNNSRDHAQGVRRGAALLEATIVQSKRRLVAEHQEEPVREGLGYLLVRPMEPEPRLFMGANITSQVLAGVWVRLDQVGFQVSLGIV